MRFGILQRYVMGEVLRAFVLALVTVTGIFVLFMVMAEAAKKGLTPADMAQLIPFIVPTSLPYTVPVSLLFSVTLFYGRMAADNEIIAVKTAGLSAWTVLMPTFLVGLGIAGLLHYCSKEVIPRANHFAMKILIGNMEENFYKLLKTERQFDNKQWPFFIRAKDVEGRMMIGATFKHRAGDKANPNRFDLVVHAEKASIRFLFRKPPEQSAARIYLKNSETIGSTTNPDVILINNKYLEYPIPIGTKFGQEPRIQELTNRELEAEMARNLEQIRVERKLQAIRAAMRIAAGQVEQVDWPRIDAAFKDYQRWDRKVHELETEMAMRSGLSFGSFFFVFLGAPVGILFARRDFLSAFISCFVPIIVLYYPLTLAGVNLGKEGLIPPLVALWMGNALLGFLATPALRRVLKY